MLNQKQCCVPEVIAEISATIKDLEEAEMVIYNTSPFNFSIWPAQKTNIYYRFNWVMTPVTSGAPGVVSLFEQINTFPGTWYSGVYLANVFGVFS